MGRTQGRLRSSRGLVWGVIVALTGMGTGLGHVVGASPAGAVTVTINVTTVLDVVDPNDGVTSLREAVLEAAAMPGSERVRLAQGADYALSCPGGAAEDVGLSGDLDHHVGDTLVLIGRESTLRYAVECPGHRLLDSGPVVVRDLHFVDSRGHGDGGAVRVVGPAMLYGGSLVGNESLTGAGGGLWVQGEAKLRGVAFEANEAATAGGAVRSTTLDAADSTFVGNRANHDGGAIHIANGTSRIVRSDFHDNETLFGRGGALFGFPVDELTVNDSSFTENAVREHNVGGGGAIYLHGALVAKRTLMAHNTSAGSMDGFGNHTGGNGGAIYGRGSVRIIDSDLEANHAGDVGHGGAVFVTGHLVVNDSTLRDNTAGGFGGAVTVVGEATQGGSTTMRRSTVEDNQANSGAGGVFSHVPGETLLVDAVIQRNAAVNGSASGGGLHLKGAVRLTRVDVRENTAGSVGAGLYLAGDTDAKLNDSEITLNAGNNWPGIGGPATGTTILDVDPATVHGNLGIVTAEIGGVVLL